MGAAIIAFWPPDFITVLVGGGGVLNMKSTLRNMTCKRARNLGCE